MTPQFKAAVETYGARFMVVSYLSKSSAGSAGSGLCYIDGPVGKDCR